MMSYEEIIAFGGLTLVLFVFVIHRMVSGFITLRALSRISFVPRTSLCLALGEYGVLPRTNQDELCRLFQKEPVANPIDLMNVPGHCESIRWSRKTDCGEGPEIEVQIELIGEGFVDVFLFVSRFRLSEIIASRGRGRRFDSGTETFVFKDSHIASDYESSMIPIVVVISGHSDDLRELSGGYSTVPGGPMMNCFQFLTIAGFLGLNVRCIYMQQEECMVCYERPCNTVIIPCLHCSVCTSCMLQLRNLRCVVCRFNYQTYLSLPNLDGSRY